MKSKRIFEWSMLLIVFLIGIVFIWWFALNYQMYFDSYIYYRNLIGGNIQTFAEYSGVSILQILIGIISITVVVSKITFDLLTFFKKYNLKITKRENDSIDTK